MKTNQKTITTGLKNRSEQLGTEKRPTINFTQRMANRSLDTEQLLTVLRTQAPNFYALAEVVGQWVWIQFAQKQPSQVTRALAEFGFHWNKARRAWQHPCGVFRDVAVTFDPRKKFGSYFPADIQPA